MLDFLIVLGQIPGTQYQLDFYEIVAGVFAILVITSARRRYRSAKTFLTINRFIWLEVKILRRRGRPPKLLALWIDHTNPAPQVSIWLGWIGRHVRPVR